MTVIIVYLQVNYTLLFALAPSVPDSADLASRAEVSHLALETHCEGD